MQAFIEERFPEKVDYGLIGGPKFNTDIVITQSGGEKRAANWLDSLNQYSASQSVRNPSEMDDIAKFFQTCKGKLVGFRFKDWRKYKLTSAEGVCNEEEPYVSGTEELTLWMKNSYGLMEPDYKRIYKPVDSTYFNKANGYLENATAFKLYKNGSHFVGGYTIDYSTGIVTLTSPGDHADDTEWTWSGEFDIPCRFDTDQMDVNYNDYNILQWNSIKIVEIRP